MERKEVVQRVLDWAEWPEAENVLRHRGLTEEQIRETRGGLAGLAQFGWTVARSAKVAFDIGDLANIHAAQGVAWIGAEDLPAVWISVEPDAVVPDHWKIRLSATAPSMVHPRGRAWEIGK